MSVIWSDKQTDPTLAELQDRWNKAVYDEILKRPEKAPVRESTPSR